MNKQSEPSRLSAPSNASENGEDGLALLIQDSLDNAPGFTDVWAPLALLSRLIDERNSPGPFTSRDSQPDGCGSVRCRET